MAEVKLKEWYDPTEFSEGSNDVRVPGKFNYKKITKAKKKNSVKTPAGFWEKHGFIKDERGVVYYSCHYCHNLFTKAFITKDHIIPKSKGGLNRVSNYVPACSTCNQQKSDMSYEDFVKLKSKKP